MLLSSKPGLRITTSIPKVWIRGFICYTVSAGASFTEFTSLRCKDVRMLQLDQRPSTNMSSSATRCIIFICWITLVAILFHSVKSITGLLRYCFRYILQILYAISCFWMSQGIRKSGCHSFCIVAWALHHPDIFITITWKVHLNSVRRWFDLILSLISSNICSFPIYHFYIIR